MTHLGIDLGTSGVKVILTDRAQNLVGAHTAPLHVSRPHDAWSEQNPNDWITATQSAIHALRTAHAHEFSTLQSIGLSGQMHGATLLGDDDQPLRPCMLWNDTRAHLEAAAMDADPAFRAITGNIVFPGFTAPKLAWVQKHEPEIFAKIHKVLLPKDVLRLWLTGEYATDMSDAAGTSWLDVGARAWSAELLTKTNLTIAHMPILAEGTQSTGTLRKALSIKWGIANPPIIAGGGGDNAASAVGAGVVRAGQGFLSLGTSGVLFAANDTYKPNAASAVHTFCHALPNTWHQMGVILAATDALNWYAKITDKSAAELTNALGDNLKSPSQTLFLPYLGGERTPHNDAQIRGAFLGLEHATTQEALTQAVIEGVAFAFKDCQNALHATGTTIENLIAMGGGSLSRYWLTLCATVLDTPIDVPEGGDFGGALGAARLGMLALGGTNLDDICTSPKIYETIMPDTALKSAFDESYARYRSGYEALKGK